jgi:hypothetical protein
MASLRIHIALIALMVVAVMASDLADKHGRFRLAGVALLFAAAAGVGEIVRIVVDAPQIIAWLRGF